jgi:3,4-dihydroxy 2-butanone 4-phosphate synthase/GTP cyclohydrolase II
MKSTVDQPESLVSDLQFDPVPAAIAAIARGEIVVVVDDEDRENEGDLVMAAGSADAKSMSFFVRHTSGFVCVAMHDDRADELGLPLMVPQQSNGEALGTAFAVSVDAKHGVGTGISATDRATTARALAAGDTGPEDLTRPGHVMPLRARRGGVLERTGHTEATVDLCSLAGLEPVGVLCELVDDDGSMSRRPSLFDFARRYGLSIVSIADLVAYRRLTESAVDRISTSEIPTEHGIFTMHVFRESTGTEHAALVYGTPHMASPPAAHAPVVRVHSECLTGDAFGSLRCDCGPQLQHSLAAIAQAGSGALVYMRGHEGRGIGLGAKIAAYSLQDSGFDTVDANTRLGLPVDGREYGAAAAILHDLGLPKVRLVTNSPDKITALRRAGIAVEARVSIPVSCNNFNAHYLTTKRDRLGHMIDGLDDLASKTG